VRPRSLACLASVPVGAALLFAAPCALAQGPDTGAAVVAGAAVFVASFAVGGLLLAATTGNAQSNAGWFTIESGFALGPLASHAVVGEWGRGRLLSAPPATMIGGTAVLFDHDSGTILHGSLTEQRIMWGFFSAGLLSGMFGVVDAALAKGRSSPVAITPTVGAGRVGLEIGGTL
jgi:hypothetical protein